MVNNYMNQYNKYIFDILNESVLDIPRNSLDATVFQFKDGDYPIMNPMIKTQILHDIETIAGMVHIEKFFVVGSILTKNYTPHSDIDVNVQIRVPKDRMISPIFDLVKKLNGSMAAGTTHPINYYIMEEEYDLDKTEAAYDVANEVWIKEPKSSSFDANSYMNKFQNTVEGIDFTANELRRHIIDLEELKSLDKDQVKNLQSRVEEKMADIEDSVDKIIDTYKNVKSMRKNAFEKDMSPAEIRSYGSKNKLPENVIYKMLERYYYFDFIKQIQSVIEDNDISDKDIKKIKKAGQEFWK